MVAELLPVYSLQYWTAGLSWCLGSDPARWELTGVYWRHPGRQSISSLTERRDKRTTSNDAVVVSCNKPPSQSQ